MKTEHNTLIKKISEDCNPYRPECTNKHLWSEGFRAGYEYVTHWNEFEIGSRPEYNKPVLVKSFTGQVEVAKYIKSETGINYFDKEKELTNFTVKYWRELF